MKAKQQGNREPFLFGCVTDMGKIISEEKIQVLSQNGFPEKLHQCGTSHPSLALGVAVCTAQPKFAQLSHLDPRSIQ